MGGREGGREGGHVPWDRLAIHLKRQEHVPPSIHCFVDGNRGLVGLVGHVFVQPDEVDVGEAELFVLLWHA